MQDLAFGPNADILTAIKEHHTAAMGEIAWQALPVIKARGCQAESMIGDCIWFAERGRHGT